MRASQEWRRFNNDRPRVVRYFLVLAARQGPALAQRLNTQVGVRSNAIVGVVQVLCVEPPLLLINACAKS